MQTKRKKPPLLTAVSVAVAIVLAAPAWAAEAPDESTNYHAHGKGLVAGGRGKVTKGLLYLALDEGRSRELKQLFRRYGLGNLPFDDALERFDEILSITQDHRMHQHWYDTQDDVVQTLFPGAHFGSYVRNLVKEMAATAKQTLAQFSPQNGKQRYVSVERVLDIAKEQDIDLDGIKVLLGLRRMDKELPPSMLERLQKDPRIWGIDIIGPEIEALPKETIRYALKTLSEQKRPLYFRIHAGEGYSAESPDQIEQSRRISGKNVNIALDTLEELTRSGNLYPDITFILGHVVHVAHLESAISKAYQLLQRGVNLLFNDNPFSNVNFGAIDYDRLDQIGIYHIARNLGVGLATGTDDVRSLGNNRVASQLLLSKKYEQAADYLRTNMKRKRPRKRF